MSKGRHSLRWRLMTQHTWSQASREGLSWRMSQGILVDQVASGGFKGIVVGYFRKRLGLLLLFRAGTLTG